ncbi:uncharacterized protein BJX67DRAFT_1625 [Aspergillus lucknowensis]|uniref:Uncharacterized protein n=1 Tax=Aspergillus lucknowensis TaxID=176173 RepID=A0ABR4M6P7_9EURO
MSANPSIIFYDGRRCTKVPRQPRATNPPTSGADTSSVSTSTIVAPTDSITHATFTTETSTTLETSTPLPQPGPSGSHDESTGPPYATILGVLFGVLGFIALVAIIVFLLRRSRRKPAGWGGQLMRDGRESADSTISLHRDYRPRATNLADASAVSSTVNTPRAAPYSDSPGHHKRQSPPYSDPFADLAEVPQGTENSVVPLIVRSSATNPDNAPTPPAKSHAADRDSVQSGTSLGSTLVLPGRSSIGSSFHRLSFPNPAPEDGSFQRAVVRGDTHSDPFDLDSIPLPASRRSSGVMPSSLI